jgi:tetratricopeptide (TPR) repeat protein
MPLTIYFFRNTTTKNIVRATVPYVIVAVIYLLMRVAFVENDSGPVVILSNNNALMAAKSYSEKLATALFIQLKYIILLVFPHPLSWDYSYNQIPLIDIANVKALAAIVVIGAMLVYAIKNIGKKDVFAYCILFYAASVVITSNIIVTIGATMAERFIFTGSLAFCMAVVLLLAKLFKTDKANISFANAKNLFVVVCVIAVLYAGKTMARNEVWQNNTTLYESGTETAPESWRVHYLLAVEYTRQISTATNPVEKRELFNKSIAHYNKSDSIMPNNSDLLLLRGYAYEFAGVFDSAYSNYNRVTLLDKTNKTAYNNMGSILLRKGAFQEGIAVLSKALALDSNYTEALANTGACYGNSGNFPEAAKYYEHAVRVNPEQPKNVWQSMTNIYTFMGDSAHAQKYRRLLQSSK